MTGNETLLTVFRKEAALFRGRPVLWLAAVVIALIPALYCVIYLGALWDPYGNLGRVPAGLVNLDRGTDYRGNHYNLGKQVVAELEKKRPFDFVVYDTAGRAEEAVRSGDVYFALVVPPDFSARAVPGNDRATLSLITSQGTSFIATLIAGRFAEDTADGINRRLAIERWKAVLGSEVVRGLDVFHDILKIFGAGRSGAKEKAEDMAVSVLVETRNLAPVSSNGPGFAPYFMALSLWLGVLMSAFLFHLIVYPASVQRVGNAAKIVGKGLIPLAISLAGALLLGVTVHRIMGVRVALPAGYYAVLAAAVFTFSAIILSLVRLIGDAGKLLAVLFLVVQIASAGGAYPIETSPSFYRAISPWLPMTHVVEGLRAAMFGSYGGDWTRSLTPLIPWAAIALGASFLSTKRFRYVDDADYGPALDLSFK